MKPTSFLTSLFLTAVVLAASHSDHPVNVQPGGRLQLTPGGRPQHTRGASLNAIRKRNPSINSMNWAGAFLPNPPIGETFESAMAEVRLPVTPQKGKSVSIWVGIDGIAPGSPLIQGGVYMATGIDGTTGCWAWTEWVPDEPVYVPQSQFPCRAGDTLQLAITVKAGEQTAMFFIENGSAASKQIEFSPNKKIEANKAQGKSAEWIVEQADGTTLSKFDSIIFTDAGATTSGGHEVKVSGATTVNLKMQNQPVLATGSLPANDQVKITYNGL